MTPRAGMRAILGSLADSALLLGDDYPTGVWLDVLASMGPENALKGLLTRWCVANPVPLVLLVDEIDSLVGDTLLSVLRQLRAGYQRRLRRLPAERGAVRGARYPRLPHPVEHRGGHRRGQPVQTSRRSRFAWAIFTEAETRALMAQHTEETGQRFSPAALDSVWTQTRRSSRGW